MIKIYMLDLGYVGLPLYLAISKKYKTAGFDINRDRIASLLKKR
jgi:UDP-N-acetyl-D-galactosamine dehydrogenase